MINPPLIYTVRLDLTNDIREEFNTWADTRHMRDLLEAGFLSATRFRAYKGKPEYMHIYEIPSATLFQTEKYKNVANKDITMTRLQHGISNHSASIYEQIVTNNVYKTSDESHNASGNFARGLPNNHLITVQMEVKKENEDELVRWHQEEHIPMLLKAEGMVNGRLCKLVATHPSTPSLDLKWVSIFEMELAETLKDKNVKEANETDWAERMHSLTSNVRLWVMERITPD